MIRCSIIRHSVIRPSMIRRTMIGADARKLMNAESLQDLSAVEYFPCIALKTSGLYLDVKAI